MHRLLGKLASLRFRSLDDDDAFDGRPRGRRARSTDAWAASRDQHFDPTGTVGGAPPNYVPHTDEGRPRK